MTSPAPDEVLPGPPGPDQRERNFQVLQAAARIMSSGRFDFPQALEKAIALFRAIEEENP